MEQKEKLDELHQASLEKANEYLQSKGAIDQEHNEKIDEAKKEWQAAWIKFRELLMVLETLEI